MEVIFRVNSCDVQSNMSTLIERLDLDQDHFFPFESSQQDMHVCSWHDMEYILPGKFISDSSFGLARYESLQYIFHITSTTCMLLYTMQPWAKSKTCASCTLGYANDCRFSSKLVFASFHCQCNILMKLCANNSNHLIFGVNQIWVVMNFVSFYHML